MSRKSFIFLTLIIIGQIILIVHFMNERTMLFADEIWSYGLANSYDSAFLYPEAYNKDKNNHLFNHWTEGKRFFEYITVQENERFSFDKVYKNQMEDVHPPLYYFILHTVCSLFPDTFSKWYGQSINLIVFILAQIALYYLAKQIFKKEQEAIWVCCLYGFCMGAVNTFLYIRMYALLTCIQLAICYFIMHLLAKNEINKRECLFLFILGFLGFLIHNYFSIFYFSIFVTIIPILLADKKYCFLFKLIAVAVCSFIGYYLYFPGIFVQAKSLNVVSTKLGILGNFPLSKIFVVLSVILSYTWGIEASWLLKNIKKLLGFCDISMNWLPVWLFIIVFIFVLYFALNYFNKKNINKKNNDNGWLVFGGSISIYIVLLSSYLILERSNLFIGRYFFSILPFFSIVGFQILNKISGCISYLKIRKVCLVFFIVSAISSTYLVSVYEWCYSEKPYREEIALKYKDASIVYVTEPRLGLMDQLIHGRCQDFMFTKKVFPVRMDDSDIICETIENLDASDNNLLLIPAEENGKELFFELQERLGRKLTYLYTDDTYVFTFNVFKI